VKKFLLKLFVITALSSCASKLDKRGYMFDLSDHELLQEGVTTKSRLLKNMGSPTLISDLKEDEAWIYYSEILKSFLFFTPKITERTILVARFDKSDNLEKLERISLSNENTDIKFFPDYTMVESHKVSLIKSLFTNVGKITPQ
jgi:outer membrane protein assembly factor BamE (lipoprotein component of BamABCDE complex)